MKQLFDYVPVIVFFALYFGGGRDIMLATWGIIIASVLQVTLGWLIWRKLQRLHLIVLAVTLVFGGMTLAFHNDIFIKWRPSIISFVLATILLLGHFLRRRNLLQRLAEALMQSSLGHVAKLERRDWNRLNLAFVVYFVFIGWLNLYVAYHFSTNFWVNFKLFGLTIIQFLFYVGAFFFIYRRMSPEDRARLFHHKDDSDPEDKDKDALRDHQ